MNDKKINIKPIILTIVILLIICIILLIVLVYLKKDEQNQIMAEEQETGEDVVAEYAKTKNNTITSDAYFSVTSCMKQYLSAINTKNSSYYAYDENGNEVLIIEEKEIKQKIYNMLSEKYIAKNSITVDNIYDHIETIDVNTVFVPLKILLIQDDNVKSFAVYGLVENIMDLSVQTELYAIVNLDIINSTFSIEPIYGESIDINNIQMEEAVIEIKYNEDNSASISYTTYEDIVKDYINLYKRITLGAPEKMYDILDKDYREAKFGNLEGFKEYVNKNKDTIIGIRAESYQVSDNANYTQYTCIDQYGNYYIFREKAVLDYTVILDTYTIDLPEFTEKYNNATDDKKVGYNIQKIFDAINDGNYEYVYNKLDNTFKQNNFKTLADFETYAKKNFYTRNEVTYKNYEKSGDVYIYNIQISDANSEEGKTANFRVVMQLKEGTDFVMSFSKN